MRLFYSLKSVETSTGYPEWPWSIRQVAIYHSFDLETGKAFWIVIKGSELMKNRIQAATHKNASRDMGLKSFGTTASSFSSSLAAHLVICDWCDEEWRWYLNFLEKKLHDSTRRSLAIVVREPSLVERPVRQETQRSSASVLGTLSQFTKRTLSTSTRFTKSTSGLEKIAFQAPFPQPPQPVSPPLPPPPPPIISTGMPRAGSNANHDPEGDFTFGDLQHVQHLEECANEVSLVLETNIDILMELRGHYMSVTTSDDSPEWLKTDCKKEVGRFDKRVSSIITDLKRQRSRTEILQRLLGERKSLVSFQRIARL